MIVKWSLRAERVWYKTLQQINDEFGYRTAVTFRKETSLAVRQIRKFPKSGPPEDLLASADKEYRGLAFGTYNKMIYYIAEAEGEIHIDDIWDTRREPKNQAEGTLNDQQEGPSQIDK